MFDIQSYQKAESVSDAIRLLGEDPEARLIAGGTDVLIKLREFEGFSRLVDIHDLPELKPITREADGTVRVGSGASFTDLEESPIIRECIPMLGESAASVAGPQIRNMAYSVSAPIPVRCPSAEAAALGRSATPEALPATLAAISAAVEADVQPRTSWRANRDFRMHIIRTLAERVIARCVVRAVELQEAASC